MTLDDYRNFVRVHFELDEEDLPNVLIDAWVREGQARILRMRRDWPHLETVTTITLEPGVAVYALPTGLRTISSVLGSSGKLRQLHESAAEAAFFEEGPGEPTAYSRWQQEVQFWPTPTEGGAVTVRGYRHPINFVSSGAGASPDLPEDFHDLLLEWVMAKAYLHQDDPELAGIHRQTFDDLLNVMVGEEVQPETDQPLIFGGGSSRNTSTNGSDYVMRMPPPLF